MGDKVFNYDVMDEVHTFLITQNNEYQEMLNSINNNAIENMGTVATSLQGLIDNNTEKQRVLTNKKERIFGSGYAASYQDFNAKVEFEEEVIKTQSTKIKTYAESIVLDIETHQVSSSNTISYANIEKLAKSLMTAHKELKALFDVALVEALNKVGFNKDTGEYDFEAVKELLKKDITELSEAELMALGMVAVNLSEKDLEEFMILCLDKDTQKEYYTIENTGLYTDGMYSENIKSRDYEYLKVGDKYKAIVARAEIIIKLNTCALLAYSETDEYNEEKYNQGIGKLISQADNLAILKSLYGLSLHKDSKIEIIKTEDGYKVEYTGITRKTETDGTNTTSFFSGKQEEVVIRTTDSNTDNNFAEALYKRLREELLEDGSLAGTLVASGSTAILSSLADATMTAFAVSSGIIVGKQVLEVVVEALISDCERRQKNKEIKYILDDSQGQNATNRFLEEFRYQVRIIKSKNGESIADMTPGEATYQKFMIFKERAESHGNYAGRFDSNDYDDLVIKINEEKGKPQKPNKGKYFKILEENPTLYYELMAKRKGYGPEAAKEYARICNEYFTISYTNTGDNAELLITLDQGALDQELLNNEVEFAVIYEFMKDAGVSGADE